MQSNNYELEEGSIQYGFSLSRHKMQFMAGGYANGKTTALAVKGIRLAADYPGSTGLLARATYPKLNGTLRRVFFKWCPPEWIKKYPTKDDNTVVFRNNSIIDFRYISQRGKKDGDGQGTSNLLSATYDWIGVDQVEDPEITQKDILDLFGRLRGDTPYRPEDYSDPTMPDTGPRFMMLTCNPTANWVFKEYINPYLKFKKLGLRMPNLPVDPITGECIMEVWEGSTYTNAKHLKGDYIRSLEALYRGQMRKRFLEGEWAAFEGLVYPEFDLVQHGLTRDQAEAHLVDCVVRHVKVKFIEAYDFGISSPTCYILAFVDDWGRITIIDGFYEPNFPYTKHEPAITKIRNKYIEMLGGGNYQFNGVLSFDDPINADPSIYKHRIVDGHKDTGHTVSDLLTKAGLKMRPANNDIVSGIAKVGGYLGECEIVPHIAIEKESGPLLYIVTELDWFQEEISNYYWKRDSQGRLLDVPQDHNDHAMDTVKYLLSFVQAPSEVKPPPDKVLPPYLLWHEMEERAA